MIEKQPNVLKCSRSSSFTPSPPVLPLKSRRPKPRLPNFLNDSIERENLVPSCSYHVTGSRERAVPRVTNHGDHLLPDDPRTPKVENTLRRSSPPEATGVSNDSAVEENAGEEVSLESFKDAFFRGGSSETYIVATGASGDSVKEELQQINIRMKRIKAEQEKLKFVE